MVSGFRAVCRCALQTAHRFSSCGFHTSSMNLRQLRKSGWSGSLSCSAIVKKWRHKFVASHIPEPVESANLIVAHACSKKMIHEVPEDEILSPAVVEKIDKLCRLRLTRCPVQYVIQEWDFHDMTLTMRPPVLIPRPETEELVEYIVQDRRSHMEFNSGGLFLDIGCGSGAIALHLLRCFPESKCVAVDKSLTACDLTWENAERYSVTDRLHVIQADIMSDKIRHELSSYREFDLVVSNPPYIPTDDLHGLADEVRRFEDPSALNGGVDGLDVIRQIISVASTILKSKSCLWLEVDLSHPNQLAALVQNQPDLQLIFEESLTDFTNRERFCKLRKR